MILKNVFTQNVPNLLRVSVWLAGKGEKESALLLTEELIKHNPTNKACRATHARIKCRTADEIRLELTQEQEKEPIESQFSSRVRSFFRR